MPIYRERYRRRDGALDLQGRSWAVIAAYGLRALMRRRAFVYLMIVAWIPAVVRGVQMYAVANVPQAAAFLAVTPQTFRDFLQQQELFVFFITVYAGSGLIADDIRSNALQLYLSRPITRMQYAAGKFAILGAALAFVTWVPGMVLLLVQVAFAGSAAFVRDNLFLLPAITLLSILQIALATFLMLAISSTSKSRWFVSILYAGLAFFTQAVFAATRMATTSTSFSWIAVFGNLAQIGDVIFRLEPRYDTPPVMSALAIAAIIAASIAVLNRRIRAIEVVT